MAGQQEIAAIPLVEERISVRKREIEGARVRVRVSVEEREERVPVTLAHDEVEVERVPKNLPLSELPSVRLEGSTTIIPVVEEVLVVEKRLVLVEEIHVRRKTGNSTEEISMTLRSEQASIERSDEPAAAPDTNTEPS